MLFVHLLLFLFSGAVIWGLSGLLVSATDRVAQRYKRPGFAVAFFVLGLLTSISEFSVAANATIEGVPHISAGNLVGGSLVIFLLLMPILAVLGGGVAMSNALARDHLALLLLVVALPSALIIDGNVKRWEGVLMLMFYALLIYSVQKRRPVEEVIEQTISDVETELLHKRHFLTTHKATLIDLGKIIFAAVMIFVAGRLLVDESVYFAELFSIPPSLVGLLLLSIGTNAPELVIALRCIVGKHQEIAFGDYMGSAAANTLLMGFVSVTSGTFALERSEFVPAFFLLSLGLVLFFVFSRTKNDLSRREGWVLLGLYGCFLVIQITNLALTAGH